MSGIITEEEFVLLCLDTDHIEKVRIMLENGANPNSNINGSSALMTACFSGNTQVVRMLIEYGAYLDGRNQESEGIVFIAAKNNQPEVLNVLFEHMAPLLPNEDGINPYQIASKLNYVECAKIISAYMKSI